MAGLATTWALLFLLVRSSSCFVLLHIIEIVQFHTVSGGYDCIGNPPTIDAICQDGAWRSNASNNGNSYSLHLTGSPLVVTGGSTAVTFSHLDIVLSPAMQGAAAVTVVGADARVPYCYAVDLVMPQPMSSGTQVVLAAESITISDKCVMCSDYTLQLDFNTSASYDPVCTMTTTPKLLSVHYGLRDLTLYPSCSIVGGTWVYPYPIQPATTPDHAHLNFLVSFHKDNTVR